MSLDYWPRETGDDCLSGLRRLDALSNLRMPNTIWRRGHSAQRSLVPRAGGGYEWRGRPSVATSLAPLPYGSNENEE